MNNLWKGIAILGIWGSVAGVAFAVTGTSDMGVIGIVGLVAMFATMFIAGN